MNNLNIIQKAILIAIILLLLLLMAVSSFGATAELSVETNIELSVETNINPEGTKAEVTLHYSSAWTFAGFDVGLKYDQAILTLTDVQLGSEVSNFRMVTSDFSANPGNVMVDAVDYSLAGNTGKGNLLRFFFDIVSGAKDQATCPFNFHDIRFCDTYGNDLSVALKFRPVLLVYGWHGSTANWDLIKQWLEDDGYIVDILEYDDSQSAAIAAGELSKKIDKMKVDLKLPPTAKIDIIAHSFGGLVSRYYIESVGMGRDENVRNLIMIATPNHGSHLADYLTGELDDEQGKNIAKTLVEFYAMFRPDRKWGSSLDLRTINNDFLTRLNIGFNPGSTKYSVIAGTGHYPKKYSSHKMFLPGHDDGVVSVDSASLEGKGVPLYCVELDHSSIVNPYRVLDRKSEEQLSRAELLLDMYSDIIRPILEGCPPSPSSVSCNCPTGEDPDDNQQLPYRLNLFTLRLRQGDSTEGIFDAPSEGVRIEFGFTIPFGDFDFTLTSPTGREITPDVANQDPDIDYVTLDNYWYYSIKNPEPGGWQYHITAVEVPEEGVDVTIIAVAEVSGVPNVLGDVSQDGRVKANDALLVLQHAVGLITLLPEQQQAADVNGDDKITAFDAALIMQYTVGLITEFPVQGVPILVAKDDNPLAPFIPLNKGGQGGCKGDENQLLAKIIAELENSSLSAEQKRVLEELKHLLWQRTLPKQTALLQNYPNPFNPETWIPFELAQDASVTISIYNVKGQLIRTIELGNQKAGIYVAEDKAAYWNGKDSLGEKVASGMYFYTLQAGKFRTTRKMVIMK